MCQLGTNQFCQWVDRNLVAMRLHNGSVNLLRKAPMTTSLNIQVGSNVHLQLLDQSVQEPMNSYVRKSVRLAWLPILY